MNDAERIDLGLVRERYNNLEEVWSDDDPWHLKISKIYYQEVIDFIKKLDSNSKKIINIGCGDVQYDCENHIMNVDIAEKKLAFHDNPVCASAENLPFQNSSFDGAICIGSVINYCNAMEVCSEIHRVLHVGGRAIIEFESSESFEYLGKAQYGKSAAIIDTKYANAPERIYLYKPSYIKSIVEGLGLQILSVKYGHVASPIVFRMTKNERISSMFSILDKILSLTSLRKFSANVIIICQKT